MLKERTDEGEDIAGEEIKHNNQTKQPGAIFYRCRGNIMFTGIVA